MVVWFDVLLWSYCSEDWCSGFEIISCVALRSSIVNIFVEAVIRSFLLALPLSKPSPNLLFSCFLADLVTFLECDALRPGLSSVTKPTEEACLTFF